MKKKPKEPKLITKYETFPFDFVNKKVSLDYFINWCKEKVPPKAQDITLELKEIVDYDDEDASVVSWITELELSYKIAK